MSTSLARRGFLQASLATGVALGASTKAVASGDAVNDVTVGVMGMSRGRSLAETFGNQPGVRVKYLCDVDSERLASGLEHISANTPQTPEPTADFRRILDDPEVDVLICAAPNHWHAPATILGCQAGKHVYVEKPCSHNPWEGETMVKAARDHDRAVQMGNQRRSSAAFQAAIQRLHEGVIGRVYHSRSWYNASRPSLGTGQQVAAPDRLDYELWQGPAPRLPYMDNRVHYNWHWFWHYGNGELGNNGVHSIDICRWGLGVDYPTRVTSSGGRYRWQDDQETPDTHVVSYEFDNGSQISWLCLSCNERTSATGFVAFYGENGAMEIDSSGAVKLYDASDKLIEETPGHMSDSDHVLNFLTAIREGKHLELNSEILEGHKSTLMCHLGNIAQRTGRTINCRPSDGSIIGDDDALAYWKRDYAEGWAPTV
jgi:predicted dehydrogenase